MDPNPSGLCWCGCGARTREHRAGGGRGVALVHRRFLPGHHGRKSPVDWREDGEGCWVWQRKVTKRGYGILEVAPGRAQHAHRWVYEREVGEIPVGMELHHECGNRLCVNPAHLRPIDPTEHRRLHPRGG